ncbi:MAG: hypothetical protein VYC17_02420 [Nitrospinota bacterium]|nr:hypothetical protein [Nitrospinota bacterium]
MAKDPIAEFWKNFDPWMEKQTFLYAMNKMLTEVRKTLDDSCLTAKSIDQKESFGKIAEFADKDGLTGLAQALRI